MLLEGADPLVRTSKSKPSTQTTTGSVDKDVPSDNDGLAFSQDDFLKDIPLLYLNNIQALDCCDFYGFCDLI